MWGGMIYYLGIDCLNEIRRNMSSSSLPSCVLFFTLLPKTWNTFTHSTKSVTAYFKESLQMQRTRHTFQSSKHFPVKTISHFLKFSDDLFLKHFSVSSTKNSDDL